mgnify:CR=1 FL=1|tara:strand:- start:6108 stop:6281 length:174 start_codon:yes stop_codon:yes gene_type:complete
MYQSNEDVIVYRSRQEQMVDKMLREDHPAMGMTVLAFQLAFAGFVLYFIASTWKKVW